MSASRCDIHRNSPSVQCPVCFPDLAERFNASTFNEAMGKPRPSIYEENVMKKICNMLSYEPVGMRDLLHILSHPDVIELTRAYLDSKES